uniref:Uncharacterized protein n=1 Tax=Magnetococcus massalia (strain MO-1) TaxID=451514 RepID=A0A1S7LIX3_MAGMO|nr:conserved protein of unknown function [Include 7 copies of TPR repeat] [Candidatus Magnetococcus massalia]
MNRKLRRAQEKCAAKGAGKLIKDQAEAIKQLAKQQQSGPIEATLAMAQQFTKQWPEHPFGWHVLGSSLYAQRHYAKAVECFVQVVKRNPEEAEAHHNLAKAMISSGEKKGALPHLQKCLSIDLKRPKSFYLLAKTLTELNEVDGALQACRVGLKNNPDAVDLQGLLAGLLVHLEQDHEAEQLLQQVLRVMPQHSDSLFYMGLLRKKQNRPEAKWFQAVIKQKPTHAAALFNLAQVLVMNSQTEQAVQISLNLLKYYPNHPGGHNLIGNQYLQLKRFAEAEKHLIKARELTPQEHVVHYNLGNLYTDLQRFAEAERAYQETLRIKPDYISAWINLGRCYLINHQLERGIAALEQCLKRDPNQYGAIANLAAAHKMLGQLDKAHDYYVRSLELKPDDANVVTNWGIYNLLQGNLEEGWKGYRARWASDGVQYEPPPHYQQPEWDGSPLAGRTLMAFPEQGAGDIIQFVRYVLHPDLADGKILLKVAKPLRRLFSCLQSGRVRLIWDEFKEPWDCHVSLMNMPIHLDSKTPETIPGPHPFLKVNEADISRWGAKLPAGNGGKKIGVVWAGNPTHPNDRHRSIAMARFKVLFDAPGCQFYSLQMGGRVSELEPFKERVIDLSGGIEDYYDTAAIMKNLDLVIAVDTSVVHLAGALGCPTWTLIPYAPDWRWLLEREDCPWYPSMRIFRQPAMNDWESTLLQVKQALSSLTSP